MRAAWSLAAAITASPFQRRDTCLAESRASPVRIPKLALTERFGQGTFFREHTLRTGSPACATRNFSRKDKPMVAPNLATDAFVDQEDSSKRRQILDGARKVFMDLGFDGASMGEIARAAGVSKGTLYVYFADKCALFEAILEQEALFHGQVAFNFDPSRDRETPLTA